MTDNISILTHSKARLAKVWRTDGTISAYDMAKNLALRTERVSSIGTLSELLTTLQDDPHSCVIRGKHKTGAAKVMRRLDEFDDQPLHTILIEVDDFEPETADPVWEPEAVAEEYILKHLPEPFHGISYHWQLSNSAGREDKAHLFKAHLWFWLETPYTSATLRQWAKDTSLACDKSVFNPVQVHYTSAPVFEDGVADPVPRRCGLVDGLLGASVLVDIVPVTAERKAKIRGLNDGAHDPIIDFLDVLGDGEDGRLYITCPFKDGHSMDSGLTETAYFPKGTGGFEQGHFRCMHDSCTSSYKDGDYLLALGAYADDFEDLALPPEPVAPLPLPRFKRDGKGVVLATADNIQMALSRSDVCGWQIRYDTFRDEVMMAPDGATASWRALMDVDYFNIKLRLESRNFKPVSKEMIRDAVNYVASLAVFDSAIEWIEALKWDGVPRCENFLRDYFNSEDSNYVRSVSSYLWTGLAGRIVEPGVKADMVPVIIGKQGEGKSYGLSELVPSFEFFETIDLMERDADLARRMRGKLVIEIGELRGLHSRDMESIKEFITRSHESWVPKYQEFARKYPRRSIFVGTSNQSEFLADTTGNRRWLPVTCGKVDVHGIRRDRLQLWAEARERFALLGVDWKGAQDMATEVHDEHRMTDTWEEIISLWLHTPETVDGATPIDAEYIQVMDIMRDALGLDIKNVRRGDEMRVANILREAGLTRTRERVDGKLTRVWVRVNT